MVFNIFTELCNEHHYLILEHFHYLKKKQKPILNHPFAQAIVQSWAADHFVLSESILSAQDIFALTQKFSNNSK